MSINFFERKMCLRPIDTLLIIARNELHSAVKLLSKSSKAESPYGVGGKLMRFTSVGLFMYA